MEIKILTEFSNMLLYAATNHPLLFMLWEMLIKAFWILLFVYVILRLCGVGKKKETKKKVEYTREDRNSTITIEKQLKRDVEKIMEKGEL